jgi:hypothetical protein
MLQDIPIPTPVLREASSCVLETERLTLRRPTLADVKAIAHLANDRRIAENTRICRTTRSNSCARRPPITARPCF